MADLCEYYRMVTIIYVSFNNQESSVVSHRLSGLTRNELYGLCLVEDMMSCQLVLQIIVQAGTLIERY